MGKEGSSATEKSIASRHAERMKRLRDLHTKRVSIKMLLPFANSGDVLCFSRNVASVERS